MMKTFAKISLATTLLAACGTPMTEVDAGGPDPDLPPLAAYVETPDAFTPTTADVASCLLTGMAPPGGDRINVEFQLRDFQDDFYVDGATVWVFADNVIADACAAPNCQEFTTNAMGNFPGVMVEANSWYAYRVLPFEGETPRTTVFGVFQYNEPAPATAGPVEGSSVSGTTIDLIPALLGITREEGRAIVAGRVTDCADNNVEGAIIKIFDPDGNYIEPGVRSTDPNYHYFMGLVMGNVPDQTAEHTAGDGLYVVPQVPLASGETRPYRVEAWANHASGGGYQRVSCEAARIFADSVTILNLTPERVDAPQSCLDTREPRP